MVSQLRCRFFEPSRSATSSMSRPLQRIASSLIWPSMLPRNPGPRHLGRLAPGGRGQATSHSDLSRFIKTDLASSINDPALREQIEQSMQKIAVSPDAIAETIAFAISQPAEVDVGAVIVRPTAQR